MTDLAALQARFARAVLDAAAAPELADDLARPEQYLRRLAIYRENVRANRARALGSAFPVVAKIVGAAFFDGLAREYGGHHPSASGDLSDYGDRFADFLDDFARARELPYLASVGRLEWLVHRAHYAADRTQIDPARFVGVPLTRQRDLRFVLHPACALFEADYPVARIWQIHQPEYDGEFAVDLASGAECALVHRPEWRASVRRLAGGEFAFLRALVEEEPLGAALERALAADSAFDLGATLAAFVRERTVVDFKL